MTRAERPRPAAGGGWDWVEHAVTRQIPRLTQHLRKWDGMFTAHCACGREVNWDAFTFQPICQCPIRFPELLDLPTPTEVPL